MWDHLNLGLQKSYKVGIIIEMKAIEPAGK